MTLWRRLRRVLLAFRDEGSPELFAVFEMGPEQRLRKAKVFCKCGREQTFTHFEPARTT